MVAEGFCRVSFCEVTFKHQLQFNDIETKLEEDILHDL